MTMIETKAKAFLFDTRVQRVSDRTYTVVVTRGKGGKAAVYKMPPKTQKEKKRSESAALKPPRRVSSMLCEETVNLHTVSSHCAAKCVCRRGEAESVVETMPRAALLFGFFFSFFPTAAEAK